MSFAKSLYEYRGETEQELNFLEGEYFEILNQDNEEWWFVKSSKDVEGYVPSTYVKQVDSKQHENQSAREADEEFDSESEQDSTDGYDTEGQEPNSESEESEESESNIPKGIRSLLSKCY